MRLGKAKSQVRDPHRVEVGLGVLGFLAVCLLLVRRNLGGCCPASSHLVLSWGRICHLLPVLGLNG